MNVLPKRNLHSVGGSNGADVVCGRDSASDGSLLLIVGEALAREVRTTTLGNLEDNRRLDIPLFDISTDTGMLRSCRPGSFKHSVGRGRRRYILDRVRRI